MHPQTLRMYEARGLITPKRSPKNTRLYSQRDVDRLRRIQRMTGEEGLNLAGVETVLELEAQLDRTRSELAKMRERMSELEHEMLAEVERVRRSMRSRDRPVRRLRGAGHHPDAGRRSGVDPDRAPPTGRLNRRAVTPWTVSIP